VFESRERCCEKKQTKRNGEYASFDSVIPPLTTCEIDYTNPSDTTVGQKGNDFQDFERAPSENLPQFQLLFILANLRFFEVV
jgi:hypothetical protein